jgi:hypothetical protein
MANPILVARAIFEECKKPLIGALFKNVVADNLQAGDIRFARALDYETMPDWVRVVAGGNPNLLSDVAQIALEVFLMDAAMDPPEVSKPGFLDGFMADSDYHLYLN